MTLKVVLHIRANDPASEEARLWLQTLRKDFPHELEVHEASADSSNPALPSAQVNGRPLPSPLAFADIKSALAVASAVTAYKEETRVPAPIQKLSQAADRFAAWVSRHWLALFNILVFLYLALAFAAPVLMKLGMATPAAWIYTPYSFACHQLGFRSFFLFGQQWAYPRDVFQQFTGIDPNDLLASRAFTGNELLGYKVALCERDVAIYGSIVLAGIAFSFLRKKLKPLSLLGWILVGIIPIGLDGGTQLLGYLPWNIFPFRESTPLLRIITGTLFGVTSVWFAYPYVQESMENDLASPPPLLKP